MKRLGLLLVFLPVICFAQTYSESILHNFGASSQDGTYPYAGLVMDKSGNLYGATTSGGSKGNGVVFKLNTKNTETILHTFTGGTDGLGPVNSLVIDSSGNLYGTNGNVFKITSAGKYSVIAYGLGSNGPLTLDSSGNLYGVVSTGGTNGCGTIFKLTQKGVQTVLYNFVSGANGCPNPTGNLLRDGKGNMFGSSSYGAGGYGLLWEVSAQGVYSTLYDTTVTGEDYNLTGYIARTGTGAYYTGWNDSTDITDSFGGILNTLNGVLTESTFWGPYDGTCPAPEIVGPMLVYQANVYGVLWQGGAYAVCKPFDNPPVVLAGGGEVYEYDPATQTSSSLYSFPDPTTGTTDGWNPAGGLNADSAGNFYGTTTGGGVYGRGAVFKLTKQ